MKKLGSILKNKEIMNRIMFTVLILFIFRIGCQITVPGATLESENLTSYLESNNALALMNILGGGTLQTFSIFALGVSPYITAQMENVCNVPPPKMFINASALLLSRYEVKFSLSNVAPGTVI